MSIHQLDAELTVSHRPLRRRIEQCVRALDAPAINLVGPVEINGVYMAAELEGRERDSRSRSRGLCTRGRGNYAEDKPPVFTLVGGSGQRYVVSAQSADESTVRLLLGDREEESLTVYTDGFRAYDPLEDDENYRREAVIHGEEEIRR